MPSRLFRRCPSRSGTGATSVRLSWLPALFILVLAGIRPVAADGTPPGFTADHANDPRQMLALNIYHEARADGEDGMIAVGWVVLNRVEDEHYPDSVLEVIKQHKESSRKCEWGWWCDGKSDRPRNPELWAEALEITDRLLENPPPDPTDGAIWVQHVKDGWPSWLSKEDGRHTATIGDHIFFARR